MRHLAEIATAVAMQIDVFSDPICPWCYIGKTNFKAALASYPNALPPLNLRWRMFRLNPTMPVDGMDRQTYLEQKFGGPEGAALTYGRIKEAGAAIGIDFQFDAIKRTPNTIKAHQLIYFANENGLGDALTDALFTAYFELGRDIGDVDVLAVEAEAIGLAPDGVKMLLSTDTYVERLEAEEMSARRAGVSGVPFFVFLGKHGLSGAQPPKAFHHVFDLIAQEAEGSPPPQ